MPVKHQRQCAVCVALEIETSTSLSRVVVEGRTLSLCRSHAATVATEMPQTFDDLRMLFAGMIASSEGAERRSPIPRRDADDRRVFPPRPEGRRLAFGRRSTDLLEV